MAHSGGGSLAGVVKFKLFWEHTIEGYQGTTTMEGSDTKILTERFRKMYPNHRIIKIKVVKNA